MWGTEIRGQDSPSRLSILSNYQDMQRALSTSHYLRLLQDTIPDKSMFVYKNLKDHLLSMAQQNLPLLLTKRVLKDALHGLAELHRRNIVHTGQVDLCIRPASLLISAKRQ